MPGPDQVPELPQSMGLRDLVLLNVSCVVGLSSLAQVAQFGFGSLTLYAIAIVVFLLPAGLMVAELNARMPGEGGFYVWTREAFGDTHAFIAAWSYWLCNMVWLPTVLLLISMTWLYAFGGSAPALADQPGYNIAVCMLTLWLVTLLNLLGLQRAKWIQNLGGLAVWLAIAFLVVVGTITVSRFGSAHPFSLSKLVPDLANVSLLPFFAIVAFSFGGLEMGPVMAGEIRRPRSTIPRALLIASILIGLTYMLGTTMLVFIIEEDQVGIVEGVAQAFHAASLALEAPAIRVLGSLLVALGTVGLFGAWLTGTARIPFVIGLDRYLPQSLAKVHPRWGSPYVSLLVQAVILTVLFLWSILGASVKEAYLVLLDMSIILYFIPFMYMFASLVRHVRRNTGQGLFPIFQQRRWTLWLVAGLGFGITLFSSVVSALPSKNVSHGGIFTAKVVGGAALLIGLGLLIFGTHRARRAWKEAQPSSGGPAE